MDAPYQETDRVSPHYGHWVQALEEGAWWCLSCWGPRVRQEEDDD